MTHNAEIDVRIFADKLYEWLVDYQVPAAHDRAEAIARSFINAGWTRITPPGETQA